MEAPFFFRDGSISMPKVFDIEITDSNSEIVHAIEAHSRNNMEHTLDGVFDFMKARKDYNPQYKVFKEYFVVCWAGQKKIVKNETFYSRVDIELINEQVRLFYSALDEVSITFTEDSFKTVEYINLGLQQGFRYYPLEETTIQFSEHGKYTFDSQLIFEPPQYDKKVLHHIYNANNALLDYLISGQTLSINQLVDLKKFTSLLFNLLFK